MRALFTLMLAWCVTLCFAGTAFSAEQRGKTNYVLALTWQPAFCQTRLDKPECKAQTENSYDARHFSLHGLWPMRQDYCGVNDETIRLDAESRWKDLQPIVLSAETRSRLEKIMPGTRSFLERHEWLKHGTCSGLDPENYFASAVRLTEEMNASKVAELFASHIGQKLTRDEIQNAFDESFGDGAGRRVKMRCETNNGRRLIAELTIGLGDGTPDTPLASRIQASAPTAFRCEEGIVDAAGQKLSVQVF